MSRRMYLAGWALFWFLAACGAANLVCMVALAYFGSWQFLVNLAIGSLNIGQAVMTRLQLRDASVYE